MSNSVVKVTDSHVDDDKLMLLVGEDGTIAPDKATVQTYLNSRLEPTDIQIMHINRCDGNTINLNVDNVVYVPNGDSEQLDDREDLDATSPMYSVKLDHDYTPRIETQEIDELAKTLSILDGGCDDNKPPPPLTIIDKDVEKSRHNKQIKSVPKAAEKVVRKVEEHPKKLKPVPPPPLTTLRKEEPPKSCEKAKKKPEPEPVKPAPVVQSPKTPTKKEKKPLKPQIPDDFALFSTPDIIRRVGQDLEKSPAKIENRSRSVTETVQLSKPNNRLSLDGKASKILTKEPLKSPPKTDTLDQMVNELHSMETQEPTTMETGENPMSLDAAGLDIDPTLLENINNDDISEDLLYQVAQSLVSNTELQNAIDKSINEGNLVLDTSMEVDQNVSEQSGSQQESTLPTSHKGTQIVRPDGRIVVIPPIERPTTRSRNRTVTETAAPPPPKTAPRKKPLDDEHVSGNELDSTEDEQEEEEEEEGDGVGENEDDPNKLWCICNQPHNNRFMICCDTCEEWYHGKCVNITKAMGQQMENEGREWICLFCKDPKLKRPQAAARRIRRASRNSRQSTDSSEARSDSAAPSGGSVPCVVCHKPSKASSIYCSETCILAHAQGVERSVERVLVFERSTGSMLTGNKAPSATNLEDWLKSHPSYEVVKSAGKIVTTKTPTNLVQSKLKLIKNADGNGVSLGTFKKNTNLGILKHLPPTKKTHQPPNKASHLPGFKIISKTMVQKQQKPPTVQKPALPTSSATPSTSKPRIIVKSSPSGQQNKDKQPVKTPKSRQTETPQKKQENIRENIQKTLFEQLTNRLKQDGALKLSEDEVKKISVEIESQMYKCFGDTGHKYKTKYRSLIFNIKDAKNQTLWRRICEKSINPYELVRLSPDDMASQELARWREQKQKHELDMIKKSEMELLNCTRQYVLKTHKGEQVLEDNWTGGHIDNTEVITSLPITATTGTPPSTVDQAKESKSASSRDADKDTHRRSSSKHSRRDRERKSSKDNKSHGGHSHKSRSKEREKRSRSRERSSKSSHQRRSRSKHRKSSSSSSTTHKSGSSSSKHRKEGSSGGHRDGAISAAATADKLDKKSKEILEQLVDNKIVAPLEDNKAWKPVPAVEDVVSVAPAESDSDHEPSSTVTIPTPPRMSETEEFETPTSDSKEIKTPDETPSPPTAISSRSKTKEGAHDKVTESHQIWKGTINMIDVATISITAHEVSGDCNGLSKELPPHLDIVGRIAPDTVWDYIGKMKCSNSKVISVVRLSPAHSAVEKASYMALYEYLSSRNRLGVVKSLNKAVKDFYILPQTTTKPLPHVLLPISGPGLGESSPALLLGIVVRDKRKRPSTHESTTNVKKVKVEVAIATPPLPSTARSYTPPPMVSKDPRLKLPLPPPVAEQDDDEPYSPEDSDPDGAAPTILPVSEPKSVPSPPSAPPPPPNLFTTSESGSFQPFDHKFDDIPGLDSTTLPSSTLEIQRQMEKLNKEIEMQKSEINSISQTIASSGDIGSNALANIALPSDLQQILDSIKTIGAPPTTTTDTSATSNSTHPISSQESDLTIPLLLPQISSRKTAATETDKTQEKSASVLSSLSEADLIRKAEEMLGNPRKSSPKRPKLDFFQGNEDVGEPRPPGVD